MPPSMIASNNNADTSSAPAAVSPESYPPSLLCSTTTSTPHSECVVAQAQDQAGEHHSHQELADQQRTKPAVVCDDASYFDGDWVSNTVQSAVTHFFGNDNAANDEDYESQAAVASFSIASDQEEDEELNLSNGPLSPSAAASAMTSVVVCGGNDNASMGTASFIDKNNRNNHYKNATHPTIDTAAKNEPLPLLSKARSLSPSFSLFAAKSGCAAGIYNRLQCDNNPRDIDDSNSITTKNTYDTAPATNTSSSNYQPYFIPADFTPQTWSKVLTDTSTIRYCGAGAAVLTAVIVIHPLALIGAVTTAAVSATAMWAVGFFHDLDKGYQIWSEEFGMLFWEENDENKDCCASVVDAQGTVDMGGIGGRVATVTSESHQIIQKDEEHLRRVFLLEQEKIRVVKVVESTGKLQEFTNESVAEEEKEAAEEDDAACEPAKSSKEEAGRFQQQIQPQQPQKEYNLRRIKSAPVKSKLFNKSNTSQLLPPERPPKNPKIKKAISKKSKSFTRPLPHKPSTTTTVLVDSHFPPLEICVVREVELPGLNTAEFFRVFFADDAPYSMRDFQKKRGDVDIVYSKWEPCSEEKEDGGSCLYSLKKGDGDTDPSPLPPNLTQERILKFNTLTKSYFGPAYAKAVKTQRATQLSNSILVIEHVTQLMDIPFSDRFRVIERWVLEVVKNDSTKQPTTAATGNDITSNPQQDGMDDALYTCKLSIHAEVDMLKSCSWESQIRKKASETFTEVATEWCKSATVALKATAQQKRKRLHQESKGGGNDYNKTSNTDRKDTRGNTSSTGRSVKTRLPEPMPPPATPSARESELFAKHRRNFEELDNLIVKGDLEWCSIEVMHSSSSKVGGGESRPFAQVLEYPQLTEVGSSMTGCTTDDEGEMDGTKKKGPTVTMRIKSRNLFKKLSSRVNKTR